MEEEFNSIHASVEAILYEPFRLGMMLIADEMG
jgi:hypothetical protein